MCTGTSGWALETTTAYCCAAAFSVALITALSRSAAQYSHPMLLRSMVACAQRLTHTPCRHASPVVGSHVATVSLALPSARQRSACCPWQLGSWGTQAVHWKSVGAHTLPWDEQSSPEAHPTHRHGRDLGRRRALPSDAGVEAARGGHDGGEAERPQGEGPRGAHRS